MEKTFVMIKPDGVQKKLVGEIIKRLENKGLNIEDIKMLKISKELAETHYEEHKSKPFYDDLIHYITSGPVVAMIISGEQAIKVVRTIMGETDPSIAAPGTIRGDFALNITQNLIHGSDSSKSAEREIHLFFNSF